MECPDLPISIIISSIKDAFWARPCLIIAEGLINLRQDKSSSLIPGFAFLSNTGFMSRKHKCLKYLLKKRFGLRRISEYCLIFIYFQAAVPALLAVSLVSVLYVEKKSQNKD